MSSISDMMKADGVSISIAQMRKDLGLKRKQYTPIRELKDIEVNPTTNEILAVTKVRVYKPKEYSKPITEGNVNANSISPVIIKEFSYATNRCKCGCYLHQHEYNTQTDKVPCKRRHKVKCEDYGH